MKVKLDENMPAPMAALFRQAGHDVATVTEQGMSGSEDPEVLRAATREQRVLVTGCAPGTDPPGVLTLGSRYPREGKEQ